MSRSTKDFVGLVERLSCQEPIRSLDVEGQPAEAEALAHACVDIETSLREALAARFPVIFDPNVTGDRLLEAVAELREDLRHILYHVEDAAYLRLILESPGDGDPLPAHEGGAERQHRESASALSRPERSTTSKLGGEKMASTDNPLIQGLPHVFMSDVTGLPYPDEPSYEIRRMLGPALAEQYDCIIGPLDAWTDVCHGPPG